MLKRDQWEGRTNTTQAVESLRARERNVCGSKHRELDSCAGSQLGRDVGNSRRICHVVQHGFPEGLNSFVDAIQASLHVCTQRHARAR